VIVVSAVVDGFTRIAKLQVICPSTEGEDGYDVWVLESPITQLAGENVVYSILWQGADQLSSPDEAIYKDGASTDSAATYFPSGTSSVTGNIQTLENLSALVSGSRFVIVATCTVDGDIRQVKILVLCPDTAGEQ
jgi:hypothetical protein